MGFSRGPASPFAILKPQNPWIDEFYVVQESRAEDFKAQKLCSVETIHKFITCRSWICLFDYVTCIQKEFFLL